MPQSPSSELDTTPTMYKMLEQQNSPEPLLAEDPRRFVMFPIKDLELWEFYKKAQASYWTAEEVDLSDDLVSWARLTDGEKRFVEFVLAFFAASDGIVNENLALNFATEVQSSEARAFYTFQLAIETVHSEMYSLLIDTYVTESVKKDRLLNAVEHIPAIRQKAQWALKWTDASVASFAERVIAFAAVEGIFFSASFCAIFWLKKRGLMPGLTFSNELISRDEGLHRDFACVLHGKLQRKLPVERVLEIVVEAVEIEKRFVAESLQLDLIGMNAGLMTQYVEFVADHLLETLGVSPHYNVVNPFDWMELISLSGRTNFFESRTSSYARANVGSTQADQTFASDADF